MSIRTKAIFYALLAALLYGISAPVSKVLLNYVEPTLMAALLYLGAGIGMLLVNLGLAYSKKDRAEAKITKKETPYVLGMILLDIAAPVFLMVGLKMTTAANASLLNNFEIVATSLIALLLFKETIGKRMWIAIGLITLSSIILSLSDLSSLTFTWGSVFVLLACISWGLENNCTRMLSLKDPLQIVVVKGFGSGLGALIIVAIARDFGGSLWAIIATLVLGFVAYGMSIYLYIRAQRDLGASRTSAFYAAAPFIGVLVSWVVLKEPITVAFMVALGVMVLGTYYAISEEHGHEHHHEEVTHEHKHHHHDGHHDHLDTVEHLDNGDEAHSHVHTHKAIVHTHAHTQDMHHRHSH